MGLERSKETFLRFAPFVVGTADVQRDTLFCSRPAASPAARERFRLAASRQHRARRTGTHLECFSRQLICLSSQKYCPSRWVASFIIHPCHLSSGLFGGSQMCGWNSYEHFHGVFAVSLKNCFVSDSEERGFPVNLSFF